ncbi:MAG TPA: NUDIX domain-containing protein [Candidatus Saccharimonas sp.]|nr:NUDIX domain-containing protein [Candidatus Saccharimonas sp.]
MNQKKNRRPNRPKNPKTNKAPRAPRAVREYTAGGVVFRRAGQRPEEVEILMIQDRLGRWTIPKGHVEAGESMEQTALREVAEETGLQHLRLGDKLDKLNFFYRREGKLIFMTTHVYLMEAMGETDALVPGDSEGIVDAKWFGREQALQLVEYRDTERLFRMALGRIRRQSNPAPRLPRRPAAHPMVK